MKKIEIFRSVKYSFTGSFGNADDIGIGVEDCENETVYTVFGSGYDEFKSRSV